MAEEIPRGPEPTLEANPHDDVLGKIDQLLNRHRPRIPGADRSHPGATGNAAPRKTSRSTMAFRY